MRLFSVTFFNHCVHLFMSHVVFSCLDSWRLLLMVWNQSTIYRSFSVATNEWAHLQKNSCPQKNGWSFGQLVNVVLDFPRRSNSAFSTLWLTTSFWKMLPNYQSTLLLISSSERTQFSWGKLCMTATFFSAFLRPTKSISNKEILGTHKKVRFSRDFPHFPDQLLT